MKKTRIAVVGAGPGGYVAAFKAADLGMDLTLIDPDANPGGTCLYRGCIPSKALLHVARLLNEAREAENWGVRFSRPRIDLDQLNAWKDRVVGKMAGGLTQLVEARGIHFVQGSARFLGPGRLRVDRSSGSVEDLAMDYGILATGSRPAAVPPLAIDNDRVLDSTGALALNHIPRTMLVVGGGIVGLELGTVYAALGTRVTVVEMLPDLIPAADRDLVRPLASRLKTAFERILLNTRVVAAREDEEGISVSFEDTAGKASEAAFEKVLVAAGRTPNSEDLGLENTRVQVDRHGYIQVDAQRRSAEPNIFAIGDVIGSGLAHTASHEGALAVEVIAGRRAAFEPNAIPNVVYTDPEVAWCGLTETEARAEGRPVKVVRFPWAASGRATTLDRNDGLTKLVIDPDTERILGVGIAGVGAGELIAEGVLAVEMAALASDLKMSIHPHPTLSETAMEAAELFYGAGTHLYVPGRD